MITSLTLETVSGKLLDPSNIDPDDIEITDIAWSLSRISRFAGHTITAIPYNVSQHCVFVADMIIKETGNYKAAMLGLLHDAAEAYIGDIPSPIKKIPEMKAVIEPIEDAIMDVVISKYFVGEADEDIIASVKYYDKKAQFIEAFHYMSSRGLDWPNRYNYEITLLDLQSFAQPLTSLESYGLFLSKFKDLRASCNF